MVSMKQRMARVRSFQTRRKTNKRTSSSRPMARRRRITRRARSYGRRAKSVYSKSRGIRSKIPFINNRIVRNSASGLGLATLASAALRYIAPQYSNSLLVRAGVGYLGGDIEGAITASVINQNGFQFPSFNNLFGGGSSGGSGGYMDGGA